MIRLDRLISKHLRIGRKEIKAAWSTGEITINSKPPISYNTPVNKFDKIVYKNQTIQDRKPVYIKLHKPEGYVSATEDNQHPTVIDLIDHPSAPDLHIAGRLDRFTTGLVLLTNDSAYSEALTLPEKKVGKKYLVTTNGEITETVTTTFQKGIWLAREEIVTSPANVEMLCSNKCRLEIFEGKHHQIKRMFAKFELKVIKLHRESIGPIELGNLKEGEWLEFNP